MVLCNMQLRRNFILVICLLIIIYTNFAFSGICRIIGGNDVAIEKYPYQLSLLKDKKHTCGAVVIHKSWALTSAACVKGLSISSATLRGGSSFHNSGGTLYTIKNIVPHPNFNDATKDYNIALVQTNQIIDTKISKPIPMVSEGSIINSGTNVIVTGWGVLTAGATIFPEKLQQIIIPVVDGQVCKISNGNLYSERMLCAGFTSGGKDICTGDYGGPMVYQDKLIGISSWSITCGKPGSFGTYTSISKLRDWIKKTSGV